LGKDLADQASVPPQPFESDRREVGITDRVPYVFVAEVGLDCAGIDAIVGHLEAAGMSQHMGMDREAQVGPNAKNKKFFQAKYHVRILSDGSPFIGGVDLGFW
jgi:hypothetical protein